MGNFQKSMQGQFSLATRSGSESYPCRAPRSPHSLVPTFRIRPFYTSLGRFFRFDDDGSSASISLWSEVQTVLSEANIRHHIQIWMREPTTLPEDGAGPVLLQRMLVRNAERSVQRSVRFRTSHIKVQY
jgi:hypothetical protein